MVVRGLEQGIRESASAIAVISPASVALPQALEEYAALIRASADRGLRFIPVLLGDVALPPFAANRVWRDFRNVHGQAYEQKVGELAAVISGRALEGNGLLTVAGENLAAALPAPPRPVTEPAGTPSWSATRRRRRLWPAASRSSQPGRAARLVGQRPASG